MLFFFSSNCSFLKIIIFLGTELLPNGCDISLADVSTNENEVKRRSLILSSSGTSGASGQTTQVMNMLKKPFGAANLMTNKLKSASSKHDLIGKEISYFFLQIGKGRDWKTLFARRVRHQKMSSQRREFFMSNYSSDEHSQKPFGAANIMINKLKSASPNMTS